MGEITLAQTIKEYTSVFLAARNFSERTRVEYAHDVEVLGEHLVSNDIQKVSDIEIPNIERYLATMDQLGFTGSTRKRKVVAIRSFLSFLFVNNYTRINLAHRIIPPQIDFKTPRFLTKKEYTQLLEVSSDNSRDFAIVQLFLQTGIKLSELTRLTINDVDLPAHLSNANKEAGLLHIMGSERKKERIVPLNFKASRALAEYLAERPVTTSAALFLNRFEKRLGSRGVEKIVSKYCKQAGITGASVQSLRHTFGTHHAAKHTSISTIQKVMGHRDIRSSSVYLSLAEDVERKEIQENSL